MSEGVLVPVAPGRGRGRAGARRVGRGRGCVGAVDDPDRGGRDPGRADPGASPGQLEEPEMRVAQHPATVGVGSRAGATSTANWWAHTTRLSRAEVHRRTLLAARLATEKHQPG